MTISAELAQRYSSEVDIDWYDALAITHPQITPIYICNHLTEIVGNITNIAGVTETHTFIPAPFKISLPARDSSGRQDFGLSISNIMNIGKTLMDQAIQDPTTPITMMYTIFIPGDTTPANAQLDPAIELFLTDIALTDSVITATATRNDILNMPFPREIYRPDFFPGLNRR